MKLFSEDKDVQRANKWIAGCKKELDVLLAEREERFGEMMKQIQELDKSIGQKELELEHAEQERRDAEDAAMAK